MNSGSGSERSSNVRQLRSLPIMVAITLLIASVVSCRKEEPLSHSGISAKNMPTMTTRNVMTIISDSGIPQYRLVCPLWLVYDNIDTPLWILPGGPFLEKFDEKMKRVFTVACDSAVNDRLQQQWRLFGNVEFKEEPRLLILTQQLTWDQRRQMVYSDSFIHIEQPDKIIEGYGFEGYTTNTGRLSSYILRKPTAVLPYDQSGLPGAPDAASIPSAAQLPPGVTLPSGTQLPQGAQP